MTLQPTNRYYYEPTELDEQGLTIDEAKWQLLYTTSDENLCDMQHDDTCDTSLYYTDDKWGITYWCRKHFEEQYAAGVFVEAK